MDDQYGSTTTGFSWCLRGWPCCTPLSLSRATLLGSPLGTCRFTARFPRPKLQGEASQRPLECKPSGKMDGKTRGFPRVFQQNMVIFQVNLPEGQAESYSSCGNAKTFRFASEKRSEYSCVWPSLLGSGRRVHFLGSLWQLTTSLNAPEVRDHARRFGRHVGCKLDYIIRLKTGTASPKDKQG